MKKILVFQHVSREHSSHIADYAKERGVQLDVVRLWESHSIPKVVHYDGLIILGGPMGAYEAYPSRDEELAVIRESAGRLPILGICLGAQLIANALGGRAYPHQQNGRQIKEIGYSTVELTEAGRTSPLFKDFPEKLTVLQWHGDTFDLPEHSLQLATGELCENQAFSYGDAFGLQFHVEITANLLRVIAQADKEWASQDSDFNEEQLLKKADELEPLMKQQSYRLMDNFLS